MTNEEILEGNVLIAKWLGWKFTNSSKYWMVSRDDNYFILGIYKVSNLKFHKDWNWLIKVLEKLQYSGCIVEQSYSLIYNCHIWKSLGKHKGSVNIIEGTNGGDTPILATFKAVVSFLKEWTEKNK